MMPPHSLDAASDVAGLPEGALRVWSGLVEEVRASLGPPDLRSVAEAQHVLGRYAEQLETAHVIRSQVPAHLNEHLIEALDRPYLFGNDWFLRAAIAAQLGRTDEAIRLLRRALGEGRSHWRLHSDPFFAPLWGEDRFEDVVRPRG